MKPGRTMDEGVSVIITKRPGVDLESPVSDELVRSSLEILIAEGLSPSAQRNQAAEIARGQIIYFLDSDSTPGPGLIKKVGQLFLDPDLDVAGGPDLALPGGSAIARALDWVQGSILGSGPVRGRYHQESGQRPATEKKLILCNLGFRKDTFLEYGGFNEGLYPNEENELLNRMSGGGCKMITDPTLVVHRPRPASLIEVMHQALRYGRGRSEQFKVLPKGSDLVHFSALGIEALWIALICWDIKAALIMASAALILALLEGIRALAHGNGWRSSAWVPWVLLLRHSTYGLGTVVGLVSVGAKRSSIVDVRPHIK